MWWQRLRLGMGRTQQRSRTEDGDDLLNPPVNSCKMGARYWFSSTLPHPLSVCWPMNKLGCTQLSTERNFWTLWGSNSSVSLELEVAGYTEIQAAVKGQMKSDPCVLWITVLYPVPMALNFCIHLEEKSQRKNSTQAFINQKSLKTKSFPLFQ